MSGFYMSAHSKEFFNIKIPTFVVRDNYRKDYKRLSENLLLVTKDSSKSIKTAVLKLAYYFRSEFSYDFVQFSRDDTSNYKSFLWYDSEYYSGSPIKYAFGATCFRCRNYTNVSPGWSLDWIWFHPFTRNKGFLTRAWPLFKKEFGDFYLEYPLSPSMDNFVKKQLEKDKINGPTD